MLVITRESGEGLWIGEAHVIVRVTPSGRVKVCIEAPQTINVRRDELPDKRKPDEQR